MNSQDNDHKAKIMKEHLKDPKYKTELCKNFTIFGKCSYRGKCRYAHGDEELISKNVNNRNYKKQKCAKFFSKDGYCPYGSRCQFLHDNRKISDLENLSSKYYQTLLSIKTYEDYLRNKSGKINCSSDSSLLISNEIQLLNF